MPSEGYDHVETMIFFRFEMGSPLIHIEIKI